MANTPNHAPRTLDGSPSDEARSLYSVDGLSAWRQAEYNVLDQMRANAGFDISNAQYVKDFSDGIENRLDAYLQAQGLDSSDPNYVEIRAMYRDVGVDKINSDVWGNSPASRGIDANDHKSQRDVFNERTRNWQAANPANSQDSDHQTGTTREVSDIRKDLEAARDSWSTISAKVQGRSINFKKIHGHNDARDHYNALVQELGRAELADAVSDQNLSEQDKNAKVIAWLLDEQNKLREQTIEKLGNTKVGKFVKYMNSGSKLQRVGKGILLGGVAGLAGGVAAGAVGAGLLATGIVGASRFVRGYATHDKRGVGSLEDGSVDKTSIVKSIQSGGEDIVGSASEHFNKMFAKDTKREQNKRKIALAMGVGSVAVGATLGYVGHAGLEKWRDFRINKTHLIENRLGIGDENDAPEDQSSDSESGWKGSLVGVIDRADGSGSSAGEAGPSVGGLGDVDTKTEVLDLSSTFAVEAGNGYTHEIVQLAHANGIDLKPGDAWEIHKELVDKVGADYIDLNDFSGSDTYSMGDSKYEVGISSPSDNAQWSSEAQTLLQEKFNSIKNPSITLDNTLDDIDTTVDNTPNTIDVTASAEDMVRQSDLKGVEYAARMSFPDWQDMKSDFHSFLSYLQTGNIAGLNNDEGLQDSLEFFKADLINLVYPGTETNFMWRDTVNGRWVVNDMPEGSSIPEGMIDILGRYKQTLYALAA